MNQMLCGLQDDRVRFQPDDEEEEVLTPLEKRLEWICSEWQAAHEADTYEYWHDIKMMLYGASMALIGCIDRYADHSQERQDIHLLGRIAFDYSLDCIQRGKYEGAPK